MNLDHNNSNSTNLGDDHDSHIAPVTTSGSSNVEASASPCRENSANLSGVEVHYPRIVWSSGYVDLRYGDHLGPGFGSWVRNVHSPVSRATFVNAPVAESPPIISTVRCSGGPRIGNRVGGSNGDGDNSVSWNTVKLFCRFGGMIMPRGDGWIYVGGDAKIVNVSRNVGINEFIQKISDICGQFYVIKYKLPEEDLDALVSVSSSDDLENMMYEYDRMLRAFQDINGQRHIEDVEGIVDGTGGGITRKKSMASDTSLQNSDFSGAAATDITGNEPVDFVEVRHEKLDLEEVEGIVDKIGGGNTRRESMASA
ncbi:hypothetical protein POM88_009936 [Heracleum sosnowskyi]|uniref:PB1 domain-containing protein n=1 Tax=Heracleum sosnowskyi TaxID=360622 RepID=A0AAD8JA25_9APIA|nr:hypothetical protein POM88_009936 [Heracleum sosnowskyi]